MLKAQGSSRQRLTKMIMVLSVDNYQVVRFGQAFQVGRFSEAIQICKVEGLVMKIYVVEMAVFKGSLGFP
jgi:hypothetical protein